MQDVRAGHDVQHGLRCQCSLFWGHPAGPNRNGHRDSIMAAPSCVIASQVLFQQDCQVPAQGIDQS